MGIGASFMLFALFYFKKYLISVVTGLICCQSVGAMSLMSNHYLQHHFANKNIAYYGCIFVSAITVAIYFASKNWILNNILGLCLALTFMKTL